MNEDKLYNLCPENFQDFNLLKNERKSFWKNPTKQYPHVFGDSKTGYFYKIEIYNDCTDWAKDDLLARHEISAFNYKYCQVLGIHGPEKFSLFSDVETNATSKSKVSLGTITKKIEGYSVGSFIKNQKYDADFRNKIKQRAVMDGMKVNLILGLADQDLVVNQKLTSYKEGRIEFGYFDLQST